MDAADHARRAQGPRGAEGPGRPQGRRARRRPGPPDVARGARARGRGARLRDAALRRDRRRRAGRHRARRAPAPARRADDHRRAQRAPRRLVAQALQVALPARPGLVRPPAVHQVPRELAGVLAEGQDRRLARDVHAGDGAQLLGLDGGQERDVRRGRRASGSSSSSATAPSSRCARSSSCWRRACPASRTCPRSRAWTSSRATSTTPPSTPGPDAYEGKQARRHRLEQLRARHLRGAVGGRRRRDDGAALVDPHRALGLADGHRARRALLRGGGRQPA